MYGSSKQGKTSLRKHNLEEEEYILVHCSNNWDLGQVNSQILKQAGFELKISSAKTLGGKNKVSASFNLFTMLDLKGEVEENETATDQFQPLELDLYDSNDVIKALKSIQFDKYIILEDFHYLKEDTQKDFAIELKAFHENSDLTFIIVGVWLEENRLTLLNGDLAGRIFSLNADHWNDAQLEEVISKGEKLLNIEFDSKLKKEIVQWSIGSVFISQEICLKVCVLSEIKEKQKKTEKVEHTVDEFKQTKKIINQQTGRYNSFLQAFENGFQETDLEMNKWLLYPILKSDTTQLIKGLSFRYMKDMIRSKHPRGENLNLGNLTLALTSATSLQIKKNVKPNIIDYDQSNLILNIVDKGFLIWLLFQDRKKLLSSCNLPTD